MGENTVTTRNAGGTGITDPTARNTGVLVVFTAISNLADGVTKIALPLMATTLTSSPALIAGVMLTLTLPWLLAALHVGVLVDRVDRRRLLWLANCVRAVVVLVLLGAVATDRVGLVLIYAGGLSLGVAEVVALISAAALVPDAVAPAGRERANAWIAGAETVCNEFAGPFVGGLLVAVGVLTALGAVTAAYVVGIVVLAFLVGGFRVSRETREPDATVHEQIGEGLRFLWRNPLLRTMALVLTALCACWGAWFGLIPLIATKGLGLSADQYGVLLGAVGVGGVLGTVTVRAANRLFGRERVMFADILCTFAMVAVPAATTNVWAIGVAGFLGGLGGTLWNVNARGIAQMIVTSEMMGRFMAAYRLFSWGSVPLGAGLAGLLAQWAGPRVALTVLAAGAAAVVIPYLRVFTRARIAEVEARSGMA